MMKDTINKLLFVVDETLTVNTIRTRRYSRLTGTFSLWLRLIVLLGVTLLATSAQNDFVSLDSVRDNSDCPLSKNDVSQTEGLNGLYRLRTTVMGQLYSTNIFRNCIGVFYRVLCISVGRFSIRRSVGRSVHPLVTFVYFSRFSRCCSCKSVCLASYITAPIHIHVTKAIDVYPTLFFFRHSGWRLFYERSLEFNRWWAWIPDHGASLGERICL